MPGSAVGKLLDSLHGKVAKCSRQRAVNLRSKGGKEMVEVKGYHHVNLLVDDLKKADEFYERLLGLQRIERPLTRPGSWFKLGNCELHISVTPEGPPKEWGHFAIHVSSIEQVFAALQRAGLDYEDAPVVRGQRRAFCHDPAGNRIELVDGPAPSP
jgi:catechol 2,3-dioxygenase-like lactoylglutathione lyase family enzyme